MDNGLWHVNVFLDALYGFGTRTCTRSHRRREKAGKGECRRSPNPQYETRNPQSLRPLGRLGIRHWIFEPSVLSLRLYCGAPCDTSSSPLTYPMSHVTLANLPFP